MPDTRVRERADRHCCSPGCPKAAVWEAYDNPDPHTATEACAEHLGSIISDAYPPVYVWPIWPI